MLKGISNQWKLFQKQIADEATAVINGSPTEKEITTEPVLKGPCAPYWDSERARQTFGLWHPKDFDETDLYTIVEIRAEKMHSAYVRATGWRDIVDGERRLLSDCTEHEIHCVKMKAMLVSRALKIALEEMPVLTWW